MTIRDMTNEELEQWDSIARLDIGSSMAFANADRYIEERRKRTEDSSSVRTLRLHAEQFAAVFFHHWDIGWAVFNPNGEGIETIEPTEASADEHVAKTYSDDERADVEVYAVVWTRGVDEQRVVRLSDGEALTVASLRDLLERLGRLPERAGEGGAEP